MSQEFEVQKITVHSSIKQSKHIAFWDTVLLTEFQVSSTEKMQSAKYTYSTSLYGAITMLVCMTDGFILISLMVTRVLILTYETLMYLLIFAPLLYSLSFLSSLSWLLIRGNTCCISQSSVQQYSVSISQTHKDNLCLINSA